MSNSNVENDKTESTETDFVPKKAYSEVTSDLHKYKNRAKEYEAKLNQLQAEKEALENKALEENQQWKALYEKTKVEKESLAQTLKVEHSRYVGSSIKNAVLREIGGFKKEEYSQFINVSAVNVDEDGNIDQESLAAEVSRIKQTYAELLKGATSATLPNEAPKSFSSNTEKPYQQLSHIERMEYKRKAFIEKN